MTSKHSTAALRVDVPTLEPDPVLLDQLAQLSSANAPAATSSRASSVRVLLAAVGVAAVTATTWAAGAVPGVPSPMRPAHHPHPAVSPSPSPTYGPATRTPGASDPTSEAPGSIHPTADGRPHGAAPGASATVRGFGTRQSPEHTGTHQDGAHQGNGHRHRPWQGLPDGAGTGKHSGHSPGPFGGGSSGEHDPHGHWSGHGSDTGTHDPSGTTGAGFRTPTPGPTSDPADGSSNGSRPSPGGQETSSP